MRSMPLRALLALTPGGRIVVTVVEAQVINRVAFEGNKKIKDEQLAAEVQSKPRGTLAGSFAVNHAREVAILSIAAGRITGALRGVNEIADHSTVAMRHASACMHGVVGE